MQHFLQRFALLVAGALSGFDRVVFKGKLCQLYSPEGMNCLLSANRVAHKEFKCYAADVTKRVIAAGGVEQAKAKGLYRYLNSRKSTRKKSLGKSRSSVVSAIRCFSACGVRAKRAAAERRLGGSSWELPMASH